MVLPDPLGLFRRLGDPLVDLPDPAQLQAQWRQAWGERQVDPDLVEYAVKLAENRARATSKQANPRVREVTYRSVLEHEYRQADQWVKAMLE